MAKTPPKNPRRLGDEPAALLARELARAHHADTGDDSPEVRLATLAYKAALRGSTCETVDKSATKGVDATFCARKGASGAAPLVLRGDKLYLSKLDRLEERLAELLRARLATPDEAWEPAPTWLPQPQPGKPQTCGDQQRAVRLACRRPFLVLTGGPGTGKTTTAACIVGTLVEKLGIPLPAIRLCAPTGRATNRLDMGIRGGDRGNVLTRNATALGVDSEATFRAGLPKALTVHKLVRNPELLANARLVVVDECSMIDIYLFVRLLEAIPKEARVLLIGDPQQLPSVDTGSVLEDLCAAEALKGSVAHLAEQFRAGGEARKWADYALDVVERRPATAPGAFRGNDTAALIEASLAAFRAIKAQAEAIGGDKPEPGKIAALLEASAALRILCSHRRGPKGSVMISRLIRQKLGLKSDDQPGGLVMVTRNDHKVTNLSNGEVGVVVRNGMVWFPDKPLPIPFSQLPPNEPAFATTIHKAQGSEYRTVFLMLGEDGGPDEAEADGESFINRQLIFTGLTRAIETVEVFGTKEALEAALGKPAQRASGLTERLDRKQA